jgi:phage terminase large subunit-like protein
MSANNVASYPYFDDDGVFTQGILNSGDTAWMLVSTALVIFMAIPGLALFYSGMTRSKHSLACKFFRLFFP